MNPLVLLVCINQITSLTKKEFRLIYELACAVNDVRASVNIRPLKISPGLIAAAEKQSKYQSRNDQMSHDGSNGSSVSDRVKEIYGLTLPVAENVAHNQKTVEDVMRSWIHSKGHYRNIINPRYNLFGAYMKRLYWTSKRDRVRRFEH